MDGNYKPENSITFDQTTARQEQQCDKQATTPAVITSENHPSSYQRNSDCRYCVRSKAAGKMAIPVKTVKFILSKYSSFGQK